ncbi:hypothetical protein NC651_029149 [Populus alba x Populus x berolinensis]|nr:hypothetical protein NC651_029149 [Populus alba x Populus x berolinensis]
MVPPGHLAASITHSPTAEEILKHAFWGLICSHKSLIHTDTHKSALSNQNIDGFLTYSDPAMYISRINRDESKICMEEEQCGHFVT